MLGIILTILKWIGIVIGIMIAAVLVLILLALFVPVRYEIKGENDEAMCVQGKAHWLFHIVSFRVSYENDNMKRIVRVLGVPVWKR